MCFVNVRLLDIRQDKLWSESESEEKEFNTTDKSLCPGASKGSVTQCLETFQRLLFSETESAPGEGGGDVHHLHAEPDEQPAGGDQGEYG